jgi:polyvinyl alcohol dehydrogenase (cytochrome)
MKRSFAGAAAAAILAASALVAIAGPPASGAAFEGCNWPTFGRDLGRSFAASADCSGIGPLNVATLQKKWFREDIGAVTAQPVVDDGTVYVGSNKGVFYALDAETGADKWTFTVTDNNNADYGIITATAAVASLRGEKVVIFAGAATLFVFDTTGHLLAARCFDPADGGAHECPADPNRSADDPTIEIESSPAIVQSANGSLDVFVGMDYNEDPDVAPAGLVKLRLSHDGGWSLNPIWKYDPETLETYNESDGNPLTAHLGDGNGCGNVWSSPMVDVARGLVVFGVGNCRANNLTEAITGLDITSGNLAFRYAPRPPDAGATDPDVDFGATPNLLPGGLFGEGGKDGHYYAVNGDGTLAWSGAAAMPSDLGGMIGSTAVGQASGGDAVFASSAIPVSTIDPASSIQAGGEQIVDGLTKLTVRVPPGGLHAIRASGPDAGKVLWDAPAAPAYGAVVFVNGVVFLPDTFGMSMQAYSADTGALLWAYPLTTAAGPSAPASPIAAVGNSIFFGSGMQLSDPNNGGVWAFELPTLPSLG